MSTVESKIRIWKQGASSAVTGTTADHTITLAGVDVTLTFPIGTKAVFFHLAKPNNDGIVTITNAVFGGGNTTLTVSEVLETSATAGLLYPSEWIDLTTGAQAIPQWSKPGFRIMDWHDLPHRIVPPTAANAKRFVKVLMVSFSVNDLDLVTDGPVTGQTLFNFFRTNSVDADETYIIFAENSSVDQDGTAYTTRYAYEVKLEDIPEFFYSTRALVEGEFPEYIMMEFFCSNDGVYADFDVHYEVAGEVVYRTRP